MTRVLCTAHCWPLVVVIVVVRMILVVVIEMVEVRGVVKEMVIVMVNIDKQLN